MIKVSEGFGHGIGMSQRLRWGDMMWERKKEEKKKEVELPLITLVWFWSFPNMSSIVISYINVLAWSRFQLLQF